MNALPVIIETERLLLQTPEIGFGGRVLSYLESNRQFFEPWTSKASPVYYTLRTQKELLKADMDFFTQGSQVHFYILTKTDSRRIIGDFTFSNIIRGPFQSCVLGYKLAQNENNKGYMTESLRSGINYMFREMQMHRIEANIIPRNKPSIRVIEKLEFKKEGLSEKFLQINGVWEDHLRYAKLSD
jgi:ribosomal-protein-alanine N-acetyltransferase